MGIGRFRDRNAAHDCCAEPVFVMAGNPNVGKSSLFNALTGLHQHTGNWTGKTVGCAVGYLRGQRRERHTRIALADLPGCYSLSPRCGHCSHDTQKGRIVTRTVPPLFVFGQLYILLTLIYFQSCSPWYCSSV